MFSRSTAKQFHLQATTYGKHPLHRTPKCCSTNARPIGGGNESDMRVRRGTFSLTTVSTWPKPQNNCDSTTICSGPMTRALRLRPTQTNKTKTIMHKRRIGHYCYYGSSSLPANCTLDPQKGSVRVYTTTDAVAFLKRTTLKSIFI